MSFMAEVYAGHVPRLSTGHVPLPVKAQSGDYPAMRKDNREIVGRIKAALAELKKAGKPKATPRSISLEAGLGADVVRDLIRKPKTMPTIDTLEALAPIVNKTPEFLAFGAKTTRNRLNAARSMKIAGEVAAGLWLEVGADREYDEFPVPFHPGYAEDAQYGLIVVGTSINKVAQPGDVLQCLDCGISGIEPRENDLVIIERRRHQSGQKEVTAKRYRRSGHVIELAPDSTDRRWSEPIVLDPRRASGDEEVAIIAIVIGIYKMLRRP